MADVPPTRFYLEENSFCLSEGEFEQIEDIIIGFNELLSKIRKDKQVIERHSDFSYQEIFPDTTIADIIYGNKGKELLDKETLDWFRELIDKCPFWDEISDFILHEKTFEIDNEDYSGVTLEYVILQLLTVPERSISCIGLESKNGPRGCQKIFTEGKQIVICFVRNEKELLEYYRAMFELENLDRKEYMKHCLLAFPDLHFADGLDNQFNNFKQKYATIRIYVTKHLSALNDSFRRIYEEVNFSEDELYRKFRADFDIDISMESSNTRNNKKAMDVRKVTIDGQDVSCEWHTKFTKMYDRIYFHHGKPDLAEGKIIIGFFNEHLLT